MPTLQPKKEAKPKKEHPKPPGRKPPSRKPPGGKGKPDKEPTEDQIVKGGDGPSDHPN